MRQLLFTGLIAGLLAASGCVGGISGDDVQQDDDGGDDGTTGMAKQMFEQNVYPIISAKCSAGCHLAGSNTSTPFVAAAVDTAYATTTGFVSVVGNFTQTGAPIWTKIMSPTVHNARSYTTDEQTKIAAWLAQEVTERNTTDPTDPPPDETPGQATARLVSELSGCLAQQDFIDLRMGEVWSNKGSQEGNCEQCHTNGYYGMFANDDNVLMYNTLSTNKYFMATFWSVDVTDMHNPHMVVNTPIFEGVGRNTAPHTNHPSFDPQEITSATGTAALDITQQIYDLAMQHKANGVCGPPRIPQ